MIYAVRKSREKEVVKTKAKVTKAKKPTKKELTEIEKLKKGIKSLKEKYILLKMIHSEEIKKLNQKLNHLISIKS